MKNLISITIFIVLLVTFSCTQKVHKSADDNSKNNEQITNVSSEITLMNRKLVPKKGIDKRLQDLLTDNNERHYSIIQFSKKLSAEDFKKLRSLDIRLLGNIKDSFYYASLPPNYLDEKIDIIKWAEPFRNEDMIKNNLLEGNYNKLNIDAISGKLNILIQFFEDVEKEEIINNFKKRGITHQRYGHKNSWKIQIDKNNIKEIMELRGVKLIQEGPTPFSPLNNMGRRRINTDDIQNPTWGNPQPNYEISGNQIRIGICDSGIDNNHDDFDNIRTNGTTGASRVYNNRTGCGSHGTHVASIAGGNGFNSNNNNFPDFDLRGHAPLSQLGDYPQFNGTAQSYFNAIVNDNTDLTNHSYVETFEPNYSIVSENIDAIIRGDGVDDDGNAIPRRVQVWAAGNNGTGAQYGNEEGYYAIFTCSKNSISVGSIDAENGRISDFSSLGPTFDGRIKPDIVAPGCVNSITNQRIQAANCGTQGYTGKCGTSMAAPAVCGVIALMMDSYNRTFNKEPNLLNPSTYKAILINTATDLVKTKDYSTNEDFNNPDVGAPIRFYEGPDYTSGYGLVNSEKAVETIKNSLLWSEGVYRTSDLQYSFNIPEGSENIQVTLAWDDEPGDASLGATTAKLVNDLDLKIIDPDGNEYLPWILDPLPLTSNPGDGSQDPISLSDIKPAYQGLDKLNNVEMVTVCSPQNGTWKIKIEGFNLPNGNNQRFSIASSHEVLELFLSPNFNICTRYPLLCDARFEPSNFIPEENIWEIYPQKPSIPFDDICKYVLNCPGCDNTWSLCPGYDLQITGLPSNVIISIVNEKGKTIASNKTNEKIRKIKTGEIQGGQKLYFVIEDKMNKPLRNKMDIKIEIRK